MNILGIGCHPDDLEIACGGTLAKYAKEGHNVFMCHTANGNMGHKVIMPDELKAIRDKEAREAAKALGARDSFLIDVDDVYIEGADRTARNKLVEVVRQCKADVIITHNPHDYMRDHEQTNRLAEDASFAVTLPHLLTGAAPCMDNFPPVFYMDTLAGIGFVPTEYVDISGCIEQKLQALACHESQVKWMAEHDHIDFIDFVRTCNKYRGLQCGVPYAEGFRQFAGWPRFRTRRMLP